MVEHKRIAYVWFIFHLLFVDLQISPISVASSTDGQKLHLSASSSIGGAHRAFNLDPAQSSLPVSNQIVAVVDYGGADKKALFEKLCGYLLNANCTNP